MTVVGFSLTCKASIFMPFAFASFFGKAEKYIVRWIDLLFDNGKKLCVKKIPEINKQEWSRVRIMFNKLELLANSFKTRLTRRRSFNFRDLEKLVLLDSECCPLTYKGHIFVPFTFAIKFYNYSAENARIMPLWRLFLPVSISEWSLFLPVVVARPSTSQREIPTPF